MEDIYGRPEKVLLVCMTEQGYQEILAYKIGNDIYTLEFMNDQLFRYEFLREDVVYVPHPPPRPVIFVHEDHPPVRPNPVEHPPTSRPRPLPSPSQAPLTERSKTEQESQGRRPDSGKTNQEQSNKRVRPGTSETNRTKRENVDSGQSGRNNRTSDREVQNRQSEDD